MDARQPYVQVPRQTDKAFRIRRHRLDNGLIETNPDWELNEHWSQAAERVHAALAIETHRLLGSLLSVVLVSLLNLLHQGLELAHGLYLPALFDGQRHQGKAHK